MFALVQRLLRQEFDAAHTPPRIRRPHPPVAADEGQGEARLHRGGEARVAGAVASPRSHREQQGLVAVLVQGGRHEDIRVREAREEVLGEMDGCELEHAEAPGKADGNTPVLHVHTRRTQGAAKSWRRHHDRTYAGPAGVQMQGWNPPLGGSLCLPSTESSTALPKAEEASLMKGLPRW